MSLITVIVVHRKDMVRLGFISVLSGHSWVKVVGQGSSGNDAKTLLKQQKPKVLLLYDRLKSTDSCDLARSLMKSHRALKVIMVGDDEDPTSMAHAVAAGVHEYLFEGSSGQQILDSIKNAASGKPPSATSTYGKIVSSMRDQVVDSRASLTPRQLQVLRHNAYGLSNQEIADSLGISLETVKEHVQGILQRLSVEDRTQAAVWAVRTGLV